MHPLHDNKSAVIAIHNYIIPSYILNMKYRLTLSVRYLLFIAFTIIAMCAHALPLDTYAPSSVLATGKWVKISVPESGAYKITRAQLQQWGFTSVSDIRVYGYGGNRIPDNLNAASYIDDLPLVQSIVTDDGGVVFYGVGPEKWTENRGIPVYDTNVYTRAGYYFVTQNQDATVPEIASQGVPEAKNPTSVYTHRIHYENEMTSPGEAGYLLVGESFKSQSERKFVFETPGSLVSDSTVLQCGIVSKAFVPITMEFSVNGRRLPVTGANQLSAIAQSTYLHGAYNVMTNKFSNKSEKLEVSIKANNATAAQNIWLDYINVSYPRALELPSSGYLKFWSDASDLKLGVPSADVTVWDVTDPLNITSLNTAHADGAISWGNDYTGLRTYVSFTKNASIPAPTYVSTVANQDIHGMETPDMIIFTLPEYRTQADRIAALHHNSLHPINVAVMNVETVYNEFASGMADVSALRKCLKMFYDRSEGSDSTALRYALIMGRATYDNRHYTSQFNGTNAFNTIPYWIGGAINQQLSDNTAFGTDDFIAMLEDGSGTNLGLDNLCVGVGRIPVTSANEAKNYVDKLYQYVNEAQTGTWKNTFVFLADDGDNGVHLRQTENMISALQNVPGQQNFVNKVYVDAYDIIGGVCQGGRNDLYRMLNEGVMWWNFSGHANNHSWTGEGLLTYTDINNMYLRKVPIVLAATCDFLRWDSNTISGGEILFHERHGGAIAMISATRPVYITDNGLFTRAVGESISTRDSGGRIGRIGDIYRRAKNNIMIDSENPTRSNNPNRLRYVLMADPAMMLPTPSNTIKIETIGGVALTQDNQVTLKALEQTEITGTIYSPSDEPVTDFNGTVTIDIYDAERSTITKGERVDNEKISFQQHGNLLYSGSAVVKDGRFALKVSMPGEVSDNFLPALINSYAWTEDKSREAVGINSEFYVYGYDDTVDPDNEPPVIESIVLNHESFSETNAVNTDPMVIAKVSDNVGINLSGAGVGHQMTITLDGKRTFTDVSNFYTPATDGIPSGEIRYPLSDLSAGDHTIALKVWDTNANSTSRELKFKVDESAAPTIFDIYTDVNPASTEVKFFVRHNRPDAQLTVTLTIYDLLGHELWTTTSEGLSNMFVAAPITWDLTDATGRRLPRGIYLYRATISTDNGDNYDSAARRIAVTAQ